MRSSAANNVLVFLLLITFFATVTSFAQTQSQNKEPVSNASSVETLKIDTSVVLVDAAVVSKKTKAIVGDLKREDFQLYEDGKPQEITHFSREELPLSVVLLLDVSSSVFPVIEKIRDSAQDALSKLKPTDHVAVMLFASRARLTATLTTDRRAVKNALEDFWEHVREVGAEGTVIGEGIYSAARYLRQKTDPTERRAIILITDDEDYGFGRPPQGLVLRELHAGNITLSAIVVNPRKKNRAAMAMSVSTAAMLAAINPISGAIMLGSALLFRDKKPASTSAFFSENTGGVTVNTKKEDVERMFVEMMTMLRTRYTFGYAMPEQADGEDERRFREIKLNVADKVQKQNGEMVVLARRGYFNNRKTVSAPTTLFRLTAASPAPESNSFQPGIAAWISKSRYELSSAIEPAEIKPVALSEKSGAINANPGMPELHVINKATLGPSYGCRPPEEFRKGYQETALYLNRQNWQAGSPVLLFNGACNSPNYFEVVSAGNEMSLVADLGDVPIEEVSAHRAFNFNNVNSPAEFTGFARMVKVEFGHTYVALVNQQYIRGMIVFKVTGYIPNERVDLLYAVKKYQVLDVKSQSEGFDWEKGSGSSSNIKQ